MGRPVKIGLIQVKQRKEDDYAARTAILLSEAEACYKEGAELVFFPEAYQHVPDRDIIYRTEEFLEKTAEYKMRCAALAKKYHAYLVPWDYEYADGHIYNSSYILDRNGEEIGRYRKVHLTYSEQGKGLTNGADFPVFDLDFGRVGIMICWDNYFPESARILGNRGAELILYPLYGDTLLPQWELKLRARAVDSSLFIASCEIDPNLYIAYTGIVGPEGDVLARLTEAPSHRVVEIDLGQRVVTRTNGTPEHIRDYTQRCRQPEAYAGLLEAPQETSWEEIYLGNPPKTKVKI